VQGVSQNQRDGHSFDLWGDLKSLPKSERLQADRGRERGKKENRPKNCLAAGQEKFSPVISSQSGAQRRPPLRGRATLQNKRLIHTQEYARPDRRRIKRNPKKRVESPKKARREGKERSCATRSKTACSPYAVSGPGHKWKEKHLPLHAPNRFLKRQRRKGST